jgi:hypothetical protein
MTGLSLSAEEDDLANLFGHARQNSGKSPHHGILNLFLFCRGGVGLTSHEAQWVAKRILFHFLRSHIIYLPRWHIERRAAAGLPNGGSSYLLLIKQLLSC